MKTIYTSVNDEQFPGEAMANEGSNIENTAIRLLNKAGLITFDTLDGVIDDILPEWRSRVGLYRITVSAEYLGRDQPADD